MKYETKRILIFLLLVLLIDLFCFKLYGVSLFDREHPAVDIKIMFSVGSRTLEE